MHTFHKNFSYIDARSLLSAIAINGGSFVASKILCAFNIDFLLIETLLYHRVHTGKPSNLTPIECINYDSYILEIMRQAEKEAGQDKQKYIWSHHILLALLKNYEGLQIMGNTQPDGLLRQHLALSKTKVRKKAKEIIRKEGLTEYISD